MEGKPTTGVRALAVTCRRSSRRHPGRMLVRKRSIARRQMSLLLLVSLSCQARQAHVESPEHHAGTPVDASDLFSHEGDEQKGLVYRLSEGHPDAPAYESQKPTRGDALT